MDIQGKSVPCRGESKYRGPKVEVGLEGSRNTGRQSRMGAMCENWEVGPHLQGTKGHGEVSGCYSAQSVKPLRESSR
jgi:hypothetical protein